MEYQYNIYNLLINHIHYHGKVLIPTLNQGWADYDCNGNRLYIDYIFMFNRNYNHNHGFVILYLV